MPHERDALIRNVLLQAVPPLMIERLGIDGILANVPENYVGSIVGAWVASRHLSLTPFGTWRSEDHSSVYGGEHLGEPVYGGEVFL